MRKIFLSSTARDLQEYRSAVFEAIQKCDDLRVVRMEDFGARAEMTDEFCRARVAECDLFVGVVGHYFGSSPKGSKKSYTQQEYDAAIETRRPRLMFVASDDFKLPANLIENASKRKRQRDFRECVLKDAQQPCAFFSDPKDLATKVVTAIRNYEVAPDYSADEKRYLEQIIAKTELLEFVGIPDPRQNAAIKLEDIFIPLGAEQQIEIDELNMEVPKIESVRPVVNSSEGFVTVREYLTSRKIIHRVTLDDALRANTRLMVLGDPGAGKSTLLRYLALMAAQNIGGATGPSPLPESRLPILIPLRRFAASSQSLVDFFYTYAKQAYQLELACGFFERALDDGRCLVLFDGLDEVVVSDQRVEVRDAVAALATRYPKNRFVVTSRIVGYESAPLDRRAFAHHTVMPFTESEIETFVQKWYAARERDVNLAKSQAEQLIGTIKGSDRLKKLAENPLMLTIIALVHRIEAELPNERVKLYDKCTEALISTWEGVKGVPHEREQPHYKHRRRLLERLAFWMHTLEQADGRQAEVKRGDLEMKLTEILCADDKLGLSQDAAREQAQAFIELAKSRTGILVERGDGVFSFVHLTFQEYFAACDLEKRWVTDLEELWKEIQPRLYHPRWREVILLLLGRLNEYDEPPSFIVAKILREHDKFDEVIHRNLFLAAVCLADRVNMREPLRNEIVDVLLRFASAEHPQYYSLCDDSIRALGTLRGNTRAGDGLLALAQDEKVDEFVQITATEALGQLGRADDAVRVLLALAQDEEVSESGRYFATRYLVELEHADDAVQLLLALAQDPKVSRSVRSDSTRSIGTLYTLGQLWHTDDAVMQGLSALAQGEKVDADVRRTTAQALGQLGRTDDAVRLLLALAQDEKVERHVRCAAAQALGQLGRTDDAVRLLLALAQDEKAEGRVLSDAAEALGQLGRTDDAVRFLLALAQDEKIDEGVRCDAAQALGELGRIDDAVQFLLTLAQDEKADEDARCAAAQVLGELGRTDDAVQFLLTLTRDEKADEDTRSNVAQALGELGRTDDAVRLLLVLAQDEQVAEYVRSDAAQALGQLGKKKPHVALALLELASDKEDIVRDAAYRALKEVVGNLRYAEVDNGQKRIERTRRKGVQRTKAKQTDRRARRR
ncbi:MAG: DUF4062 domain-containing protein [Chloroflexi bacterium]|nr:DUF4062 domain-containing protein [Chloroflexota bacterium]